MNDFSKISAENAEDRLAQIQIWEIQQTQITGQVLNQIFSSPNKPTEITRGVIAFPDGSFRCDI